MKVSLICADPLLSEGLASLLKHSGGFAVVSREAQLDKGLVAASKHAIDVVVLTEDVVDAEEEPKIPRLHGFAGMKIIFLGNDSRGIPVHTSIDPSLGSSELFAALRALAGDDYSEPEPPTTAVTEDPNQSVNLSPREKDVARLVARGLSNRNIAEILGVQEQSIKNTVSSLMNKLGCDNRVQVLLKVQNTEVVGR